VSYAAPWQPLLDPNCADPTGADLVGESLRRRIYRPTRGSTHACSEKLPRGTTARSRKRQNSPRSSTLDRSRQALEDCRRRLSTNCLNAIGPS